MFDIEEGELSGWCKKILLELEVPVSDTKKLSPYSLNGRKDALIYYFLKIPSVHHLVISANNIRVCFSNKTERILKMISIKEAKILIKKSIIYSNFK